MKVQAREVARRNELYETLHLETKLGANQHKGGRVSTLCKPTETSGKRTNGAAPKRLPPKKPAPRFTQATAQAMNVRDGRIEGGSGGFRALRPPAETKK